MLSRGDFPTPIVALRGNHEEVLLKFLDDASILESWRKFGGLETLHSYGVPVGEAMRGGGYDRARETFALPVRGLMCIPPEGEEPAMHFALLAKIAARNDLAELSMGMSGDFETAVRLGATHVRVGTAIFGTRPAAGQGRRCCGAYGRRATCRARLSATDSSRWCWAHVPVLRRGSILARSER